MTDHLHSDAPIDDALETLARPEPPTGHVARVLASTGPENGHGLQAPGYLRPRWALPVAASLVLAAGLTWMRRDVPLSPNGTTDLAAMTDGSESGPYQPWGALPEIDRPVLPPQAYWGMDAFEEWRRLGRVTGVAPASRQPAHGNRQFTSRRPPREGAAAGSLAWAPTPSGLPPIELEPIAASPLSLQPLPEPAPIDLPAITLEPIVFARLQMEERP